MSFIVYLSINEIPDKIFIQNSEDDPVKSNVDPQMIQVNATNDEIERRIQNFIERKREQIDVCNVQDFINANVTRSELFDDQTSCARVDAALIKRKDSKGHLKVKRVKNEWGPQTKIEKKSTHDNISRLDSLRSGIDERLENAENHLNIPKPISTSIYDRLKKIEDRILQLESLSPEYVTFWLKNSADPEAELDSEKSDVKNSKYNADDVLKKINSLKGK